VAQYATDQGARSWPGSRKGNPGRVLRGFFADGEDFINLALQMFALVEPSRLTGKDWKEGPLPTGSLHFDWSRSLQWTFPACR
jgi:hypothetical protein